MALTKEKIMEQTVIMWLVITLVAAIVLLYETKDKVFMIIIIIGAITWVVATIYLITDSIRYLLN